MIVEKLLEPEHARNIARRVEQGALPEPCFDFSAQDGGTIFGPFLEFYPDLEVHAQQAELWKEKFRQVSTGGPDLQTKLLEALKHLAGGKPLQPLSIGADRAVSWATLRRVDIGKSISPHFENGLLCGTGLQELLRGQVDTEVIYSFFVVLDHPGDGAELVLYDARWNDRQWSDRYPGESEIKAAGEPEVIVLRAGDFILFDAGRFLHAVSANHAPQSRWSLGGFAAQSCDHRSLVYWG